MSIKVDESTQLDGQVWRVYDLLHRTSIFCESMEECQHLIQHFVDTEVEYYKSVSPADAISVICDDDIVSPLGYEVVIYVDETYYPTEDENVNYSCKILRSRICHYIYYHDRDEEEYRNKCDKEFRERFPEIWKSNIKDKPRKCPKLVLEIDGEKHTFVPENSDDWYPF